MPQERAASYNNSVKIGLAGLGFMGATHLNAYLNVDGVEVAAVCSENALTRSADLTGVGGNFHQKREVYDLSSVRKYQNWRALVEDPEVQAVDVCLPSDLHATVAIAALRAGKHVLCEKPMALSSEDCDRMVAASEKYGRTLMIGQVLRFWPEYRYLSGFVNEAEYGRIRSATFVRRCGVPDWSCWLPDESRSGGAVLDLLSHDIDQALALFGVPQRVAAKSIGGPDTAMATLLYPDGPEVRIQGGWFAPQTPLSMTFQVRAERAELEWMPRGLRLSDERGQVRDVSAGTADAYQAEIGYFVDCCRTRTAPTRCPAQESALAVKVALLIKRSRAADGQQVECAV